MPDRTQDLTNHRKVAVACKNYTDNKVEALKWELGSHTLDVESDTDVAFSKTVPAGAIKCHINKVGGMSYKSENLLIITTNSYVSKGINATLNNGIISINGTASSSGYAEFAFNINSVSLNGDYYWTSFLNFSGNFTLRSGTSNLILNGFNTVGKAVSNITGTATNFVIGFNVTADTNYSYTVKPMLVKGTTAPTEFKVGFEGIRDSAVTSLVSKNANNETLDTFTIPAEVQALDGYGWGVNNTCYNYIDFETKKFVKKIGRVDLGSLNYTYSSSAFISSDISSLIKKPTTNGTIANVLCKMYETKSQYDVVNTYDKAIGVNTGGSVYISNSNYTNASDFKTAMSGVYLYYELATPVETDISEYIEDNIIEVEAGGTITFTNTYEQAVPSEVDYLIEEVKA